MRNQPAVQSRDREGAGRTTRLLTRAALNDVDREKKVDNHEKQQKSIQGIQDHN